MYYRIVPQKLLTKNVSADVAETTSIENMLLNLRVYVD